MRKLTKDDVGKKIKVLSNQYKNPKENQEYTIYLNETKHCSKKFYVIDGLSNTEYILQSQSIADKWFMNYYEWEFVEESQEYIGTLNKIPVFVSERHTRKKDINNLADFEVGDILLRKGQSYECEVLAVTGKIVILSSRDNFEESEAHYHYKELGDYTFKQNEVEKVLPKQDEDAPFKPKHGEGYFSPSPAVESKYFRDSYSDYHNSDAYRKENGLCFRTSQAAIKCTEKMLNVLK